MNDSVYGPFSDLTELLKTINESNSDAWGITDSWQHGYHIQSYFLVFLDGALRSPEFTKFWRRFPYVNRKSWVIKHGEIGLTQVLTQHKLRVNVLASYWDVVRIMLDKLQNGSKTGLPTVHKDYIAELQAELIRGRLMNPSYHFWDTLITEFNCPFIKREAIITNRGDLIYNWRWPEVIGGASNYDLDLIRRHMQAC
jgi:lipopolysaccharide biosynthesis protein